MTYQRVTLSPLAAVGDHGQLPAELVGLADSSLVNLPAALNPVPSQFAGAGFWPVIEADVETPELDASGKRYLVPIPPPPEPLRSDVDAERDRRVEAGMTFSGVEYQTRPQDRENVAGAAIMALAAMTQGAQPGNLRWHGGISDFTWIAGDNSETPMDAQTLFVFGRAMAAHKSAHIFAARAIKDADPIPVDYADNAYWP